MRHIGCINLHKIIGTHEDKEDIVISSTANNLFGSQDDNNNKLSAPILKLKIRNTTEYLKWHIAILKCDNYKCRVCLAGIKDNKTLGLEVHHVESL